MPQEGSGDKEPLQESSEEKNFTQEGHAGRDILQIGRDYIRHIKIDILSGNWGSVVFALIPLFLFLFGIKAGADKVVEIFVAKPPIPDLPPTPTSEFPFPQKSCGDKSTDSNITWYPVFINGGNLDEIHHKYCGDAIRVTRKTGESAIQVASFTSDSKAQRFAKAVGGKVEEPKQPSPTFLPPSTPNPKPSTTKPVPNPTGCVITISNSLVALSSEPKTFSRELTRVRPGDYSVLDQRVANFGNLRNELWFFIEAEGRSGWVIDDTWTIDSKTSACP